VTRTFAAAITQLLFVSAPASILFKRKKHPGRLAPRVGVLAVRLIDGVSLSCSVFAALRRVCSELNICRMGRDRERRENLDASADSAASPLRQENLRKTEWSRTASMLPNPYDFLLDAEKERYRPEEAAAGVILFHTRWSESPSGHHICCRARRAATLILR
jgi:hypothetical protein